MNVPRSKRKFYIYGDKFMGKMLPLLKRKLKLDIKDMLALEEVTISKLHARLERKYRLENRETIKPETNNAVLIMVGIYDVLKNNSSKVEKVANQMLRDLTALVDFLKKYHRHIILMTAIPVLKKEKSRKHWELILKYNMNIARMTVNSNAIKVVDIYPVFVRRTNPTRCIRQFYSQHDCPPEEAKVVWNYAGMLTALKCVREVDDLPDCFISHWYRPPFRQQLITFPALYCETSLI